MVELAGGKRGTCESAGYSVFNKTATATLPVLGDYTFAQFTKPVVAAQLMNLAGCTIAKGQVVNTTMANAHTLYGCENHGQVNIGHVSLLMI